MPYLEWSTVCSSATSTRTIEVTEAVTGSASTSILTYESTKNSEILAGALVLQSTEYSAVSVVDKNPENLCALTVENLQFAGGALTISGPIDYETCKTGVTVGVQAAGTFTGCETGSIQPSCNDQQSETCFIDIKVNNLNESPYWLTPQVSSRPAPSLLLYSLTHPLPPSPVHRAPAGLLLGGPRLPRCGRHRRVR